MTELGGFAELGHTIHYCTWTKWRNRDDCLN